MFEGKLPTQPKAPLSDNGAAADEALCPLEWNDLKARLAAARELRCELADETIDEDASFDADFARKIAAQHDRRDDGYDEYPDPGKSKRGVNPNDLANSKETDGNIGRQRESHDPTNRGNT